MKRRVLRLCRTSGGKGLLLLALALAGTFAGCRHNEKRYELKGKVLMVEREKHLVTVAHEEVKGLMPAMTMPFTVESDSDLDALAPDATLTATLVIDGAHSWLEDLVIVQQTGAPNLTSSGMTVEAKEGDQVPNFGLRNQDGKTIRFKDYRGKALLLTFIYTRCPLPEYCTLMSNNFAKIDRQLEQDANLYAKTHLLSISIDPGYDTAQVLRSYGAAHTERYQDETFQHWEFASGEQVKETAQFFGLQYFADKDQIIHGLRTVIIAPDGKVAKVYTDNTWKPDEVVEELKRVVQ
ncbi:MAG TPA: SCO family protein [Pyrinomonadaceae bacterium]|nr:SCO family protein [Pyrinomonadaceae bacterium]